jgi:hypothetical protein
MQKSESFADFEIISDADGKHAVGHGLAVTCDPQGRMFHRRAIKMQIGNGQQTHDSMLVAEIDGVRVFIKPPGHIVITRKDLKL